MIAFEPYSIFCMRNSFVTVLLFLVFIEYIAINQTTSNINKAIALPDLVITCQFSKVSNVFFIGLFVVLDVVLIAKFYIKKL